VTDLKALLFADLDRELAVTRTLLAALPADHFPWKPHEKSMSLMTLALHVATLPGWLRDALKADTLDFADAPRPPASVASTAELLTLFDDHVAALRQTLAAFDMAHWQKDWTMKNGAEIFTTQPRPKVARIWCLNHLIHHRAQLALYLRLLNLPVPTVYFNTADDPTWRFD
jgi:uncharacterized damage-inducible protein DinB